MAKYSAWCVIIFTVFNEYFKTLGKSCFLTIFYFVLGAPPIKKAKENPESSLSDNPNGSLPADFFDEDPGLNIQTPWQQ
uniref:SAYSvFN domain-containing protein n=1 Tax=Heterorhabditis bacteriophora TaxID=37862 RepID=A0A1I7X727_HETBA